MRLVVRVHLRGRLRVHPAARLDCADRILDHLLQGRLQLRRQIQTVQLPPNSHGRRLHHVIGIL